MSFSIEAEWEVLAAGPPEERACFAAVGIKADGVILTSADDAFTRRVRDAVHLSGYRLAEWLAWNWWRLRWEPRSKAPGWAMAHRMTTIGGGFVWPDITIDSDGERITVTAKQTAARPSEPLRYIMDRVTTVRAAEFESGVDRFVEQVRGQLRAEGVDATNLDDIWDDVRAERQDVDATSRRRFEALLGFDPDEAPAELLERLVADGHALGEGAMRELAAIGSGGRDVPDASELQRIAADRGAAMRTDDAVRLADPATLPPIGESVAWHRGEAAAMTLRTQQGLGDEPISNARLLTLAGVASMPEGGGGSDIAFALMRSPTEGRCVLRANWPTGQRFELARLLGDRLTAGSHDALHPATRTYTYRQKMQRSFAAELLCPFHAVVEMMGGDYEDEERQEKVARHFDVSPRTVQTELANNGKIDREDLFRDMDARAA